MTLAAVAAAWLSSRHRATLGGSCLEDDAPRWGATGRRWFEVKGLPSPARATGHLTRTNVGKESAASPHFAALLPCASLHAAPPQLLLISVWRMLLRAGEQRLVADPRRWLHQPGLQPALSGLSIRPLSARHHPVACQATTRLAACRDRSDSLHFVAVYAVLLQVASRASLVCVPEWQRGTTGPAGNLCEVR